MSEFNVEVEGGSSVRLPTAGKYCDRDIVVTAKGGGASGGGGSGFTDGNLLFSEHTVTVEEGNGVTDHLNLLDYFYNQVGGGAKVILAYSLVGYADTYNQPIFGGGIGRSGMDQGILCYRYRNGYLSIPAGLSNAAYDAALVVGTQYKVYCVERIE